MPNSAMSQNRFALGDIPFASGFMSGKIPKPITLPKATKLNTSNDEEEATLSKTVANIENADPD